jgi:hypothetical protein
MKKWTLLAAFGVGVALAWCALVLWAMDRNRRFFEGQTARPHWIDWA